MSLVAVVAGVSFAALLASLLMALWTVWLMVLVVRRDRAREKRLTIEQASPEGSGEDTDEGASLAAVEVGFADADQPVESSVVRTVDTVSRYPYVMTTLPDNDADEEDGGAR